MSSCFGKSCLFVLLCVSFVNVYQFVCLLFFTYGFEGGMWDLIIFIPDHRLFFYFDSFNFISLD